MLTLEGKIRSLGRAFTKNRFTCHILLEKSKLFLGSKGTGSAGKSGRQPEAIVSCD